MSTLKYTGVNLSGLEFGSGIGSLNSTYAMPPASEYSYWAHNVGSNIIRLPFTWERLQPTLGGALDKNYLSYIQQEVGYAKANGMTTLLDLHNYGLYNGQNVTGAQLSDVWTKLGQAFKGDSSVWFDLMNEPYQVSATQWANVEQQTVNTLRANGIDNKLLLEGTAWSGAHSWTSSGNAAAFANFKDPGNNYAYDVHQYLDSDSSGTSATAVPGSGSTRLVDVTNWAQSTGQQLFLGETGLANNAGSETEMKAMINYMQQHSNQWLGFTLWGAGPWWPSDYIYSINPNGTTNEQSIQDMLSYLTPATGGTTGNQPPVAQPDTFSVLQNQTVSGNLMANNGHGADTDPNGLALSVTAATVTSAQGGTVVERADGTFTYTPAANFSGTDSFTYTLKDSGGLTATGTASVTVNAISSGGGGSTPPPTTSLTVNGTAANDILNADHKIGTTVNGGGGNDYLIGHDGGDVLNGGDGNDNIYGYWGNDILAGGPGSDTLSGGPGADTFVFNIADLGTGTDKISDFSVSQGDKIDLSNVLQGHYTSTSVLSNFVQITTSGSNSVLSVDLDGSGQHWTQVAVLTGVTGLNVQQLVSDGNLLLSAATATGGGSTPPPTTTLIVNGTAGNDVLNANHDTGTTVNGLGGNDAISGHNGNDLLNGGDGNDKLYGYYGNDTLAGGTGNDTLAGGPGADTFLLKAGDVGTGVDNITDFSVSQGDKIDISDLLSGHYNAATNVLADFVQITTSGSNSILSVDTSGAAGAHGWTAVATISGVTGLTDEQLLITHGNLVVA